MQTVLRSAHTDVFKHDIPYTAILTLFGDAQAELSKQGHTLYHFLHKHLDLLFATTGVWDPSLNILHKDFWACVGIMSKHSLLFHSVQIPMDANWPQNYLNWNFIAWTSITRCNKRENCPQICINWHFRPWYITEPPTHHFGGAQTDVSKQGHSLYLLHMRMDLTCEASNQIHTIHSLTEICHEENGIC